MTADALPLTPGQQALWLDESLRGDSAVYNVPVAYTIRGELNLDALALALGQVIARHPSLRSYVRVEAGRPQLVTVPAAEAGVEIRQLASSMDAEAAAAAVHAFVAEPLSLSRPPLLRAAIRRTGAEQTLLVLVVHHGAFDSWSIQVLQDELAAGYAAALADESLERAEVADYALHRQLTQAALEETFAEDLAHWTKRLAGAPVESTWPHAAARPETPTYQGATTAFTIPASTATGLRKLARAQRTTPFSVFTAGLQTLLARVAQDTDGDVVDVAIGTPVAQRDGVAAESLIGYLANTVVLRQQIDAGESFADLVGRASRDLRADLPHAGLPFPQLVSQLASGRSINRSPFFQVMLVVEDSAPAPLTLGEATGTLTEVHTATAKFDLTLTLVAAGGGYRGTLEYATDLYTPDTAQHITDAFVALLTGAATSPHLPVGELPLTDRQLTHATADAEQLLAHELFDRSAVQHPEAPALKWDGGELSYAQLRRAAEALAGRLGRNRAVALCAHRSPELAVALLAILKSGAGYVPLDPAYPRERLDYMLGDSRAELLLCHADLVDAITVPDGVRVMTLDDVLADTVGEGSAESVALPTAEPGDLGYVIYTSGSTGRPKGVQMPHGPLANLIDWQLARSGSTPGWNTLQFAAFSFDVAFQEHFSTWASGGTLVLVDEDVRRDPQRLLAYLEEQQVHRLFAPFVALQQLADSAAELEAYPTSLKEVVTAGEQLQVTEALRAFFVRVDAFLENQYGPSETHVVTAERLTGTPQEWPDLPPIGAAIANTVVEILDDRQQPLPAGVPGEICIAGAALAHGYLGKPEMTDEKFITRDGIRLYRTGDFGKLLPGGRIQCLGRRDGQVKIRGYRMELGEIEAQVRRLDGVADAVVVVGDSPARGKRLIAHCLPAPGATLAPQKLRKALSGVLPDYMLPAAYVLVDAFPLTPSGKVDRKTLAERGTPAGRPTETAGRAARDGVEFEMCDLWAKVLDRQQISTDDDFFDLGGDSFLGVRLTSAIRGHFGVDLPLAELFRSPTVAALAQTVRDGGSGEMGGPLVRLQAGDDGAPLYLFPPLAGTVVRYAPLARALGRDTTVYALQSPGLQPGETPCTTITEMAEVYLEHMRKTHPGGPWHLAGWSMGGVIALEAARLLAADGEHVGLVGLLDTNPRMDLDPAEDYGLRILVTMGLKLDLDLAELAALPEQTRVARLLEEGMASGALPPDYDEDRLARMLAAYRHNGDALDRHTIRGYGGKVVLFRATDRSADLGDEADDLGWAAHCGALAIREVPGSHFTMLDPDNLTALCARLADELESAR